jgi:TolB-like protein/class 3 adenylate cyclase/Flp pilus assembly protein TadD
MAAEVKKEIELEIAHVLFLDIVGYSKLSVNEQHAQVEELNEIVRLCEQFHKAEAASRLLKIPTGDGMVLVFYTNPEAPAQCAVEISRALKEHPRLQLRMGIHSGPVSGVVDVNERANLAGAGINTAKRVMDCGDAGHILISKHAAEDLEEYEQWRPLLHDLGTCEVKHGMRVSVANLYSEEIGNPQLPKKFQALKKHGARVRWAATTVALVAFAVIVVGIAVFSHYRVRSMLAAPEKSIAVLPFENLSHDPDNAYFADGIQEEILTRLAKIADLKVISRRSTQQYQSKPGNLSEIAKQLGVANILEGSVQKAANQMRVNVQLIQAASDSHLWAETYDRKLDDIFGLESDVAKAIAESLQAKLTGGEQRALAVKPTNNSEAYDAYLRGLALEPLASSPSDSEKIIGFYERSVQLDPGFALAWARLSRVYAAEYFDAGPATLRDAAERTLSTAQKLQPNASETLLAQAYFQYWVLRDYEAAKATFGLVRKVSPGSSEVPAALALITRRQGHWDESITYCEQSLTLDPLNFDWLTDCGNTYRMLRQFQAAVNIYDRALTIHPNDPYTLACKAELYQARGDLEQAEKLLAGVPAHIIFAGTRPRIDQLILERQYDEAIRLLEATLTEVRQSGAVRRDVEVCDLQVYLAKIQQLAHDSAGARATAQEAQRTLETLCKAEPDNSSLAVSLSQIYADLGEKDAALRQAERATTLLPSAQDAVSGPMLEENLANVQARCGEKDRAISALQHLLSVPYGLRPITKALLRIDPKWDDLRSDPRFQKIVASEAPKSAGK